MSRAIADERGVTLVELLVVILLTGIVMGATLTTFSQYEQTTATSQRLNDAQDQVRVGVAGLARELRNLASPTDVMPFAVVRNMPADLVFQSVSSSATRRVRYCLDTPGRRLWRQVQFAPFSDPAVESCPDAGWGTERASVENVVNGARPVFAYNATETTAITEIGATLWVDVNGAAPPLETSLQTSVFLRNQNRRPTASFTADVNGSAVVLNASESTDPEGKALDFYWYDEAETGTPAACGVPPAELPQTGCVGTGIVYTYTPPAPGERSLYLVVQDAGSLTDGDETDSEPVCVPGEGVTCP